MKKYYEILDENNYGLSKIKITEGNFKDTIFNYMVVSFNEETTMLDFQYEILNNTQFKENTDFEKLLFDILCDIIETNHET